MNISAQTISVADVVQKVRATGQQVPPEVQAGLEPFVAKFNEAVRSIQQGESSFTPAQGTGDVGVDLGNGLAGMMQAMMPMLQAGAEMAGYLAQHGIEMPQ